LFGQAVDLAFHELLGQIVEIGFADIALAAQLTAELPAHHGFNHFTRHGEIGMGVEFADQLRRVFQVFFLKALDADCASKMDFAIGQVDVEFLDGEFRIVHQERRAVSLRQLDDLVGQLFLRQAGFLQAREFLAQGIERGAVQMRGFGQNGDRAIVLAVQAQLGQLDVGDAVQVVALLVELAGIRQLFQSERERLVFVLHVQAKLAELGVGAAHHQASAATFLFHFNLQMIERDMAVLLGIALEAGHVAGQVDAVVVAAVGERGVESAPFCFDAGDGFFVFKSRNADAHRAVVVKADAVFDFDRGLLAENLVDFLAHFRRKVEFGHHHGLVRARVELT